MASWISQRIMVLECSSYVQHTTAAQYIAFLIDASCPTTTLSGACKQGICRLCEALRYLGCAIQCNMATTCIKMLTSQTVVRMSRILVSSASDGDFSSVASKVSSSAMRTRHCLTRMSDINLACMHHPYGLCTSQSWTLWLRQVIPTSSE